MNLREHLDMVSLLRDSGEPGDGAPVSIITLAQDLPRLPDWLKERRNLKTAHIFIIDAAEGTPISLRFPAAHGAPEVHCGVADLRAALATRCVFHAAREGVVRVLCMALPELAAQKTWLAGGIDPALKLRKPLGDYYEANRQNLEAAYRLLETEADREVMARRVKALQSGDPGYLPIASHLEYWHPLVRPERGDCMIDGGVSDMTDAQEAFARAVGPDGVIYGFEPIPWMAEKAAAQLASFPQYRLGAAGLAEADGVAEFTDMRDSSRRGARAGANVVQCRLSSIDSFVRSNGIPKIDCIKLDVEGAELSALEGARDTIRRDRPKLIVCLYHKPRDMFEIPLFIRALAPEYRLHMAHSSAGFNDTILYAAAQ